MYERLDEVLQIQKMCLKELHQLQANVETYLQSSTSIAELLKQHWPDVQQGNNLALIVYDNFLTSVTNIMNSARRFNIQIELNNLKASDNRLRVSNLDEMQMEEKPIDTIKNGLEIKTDKNANDFVLDSSKILLPAEEYGESVEAETEFIYPKLNLSDFYKNNAIIRASVTYINDVNNLKFSILDTSSEFITKFLDVANSIELHQYHSIPPDQEVFGLALEQRILRAVRCSKALYDQELDEEFWPCYLLDFGEVVRLKTDNITYKLTAEQKTAPALSLLCQLKNHDKNPFLNQDKMKEKLENLLYQNCDLKVISVEENTLNVQIVEKRESNESTNYSQTKESCNKNLPKPETNPFKKSTSSDKTQELTEEQLEMLYDEPLSTSNAMKAVMGYDPQDDKRICRFYNPATGACFKGSHCKLEHIPRQSDGWTKDVIPASSIVDNHTPLVIYPKGTIINITPTFIGHFDRFYAQINDAHQHATPLIWNNEDVPNWKLLQQPPHIFELVLSRYEDGLWYRAKIVAHDDDYKMFKVFYVDYGNSQLVHLRNLARIDYGTAQLPFQAVLCRFAGAKDNPTIDPDKRKKGLKLMCELILNKDIDVKVVEHYEDLIVTIVNKKDFPLPDKLIKMGYMNRLTY